MTRKDSLLSAIQQILFREWDPIGVNDNELCGNEYDSYAATLWKYLREGADEFKIMTHLRQLQLTSMGLSHVDEEHDRRIARRLLSLIHSPNDYRGSASDQ